MTYTVRCIPQQQCDNVHIIILFSLTQGLVSEQALHEVMVANLPGKSEIHLQALRSTAIQVAAGPKPATIDYIKLMTPVSNDKL